MRILWLSNKVLSDQDGLGTGTWLDAMASVLVNSGTVLLGNIAPGNVAAPVRRDHGHIQQWIVPLDAIQAGRDKCANGCRPVLECVAAFRPDLVHVWGTEHQWGLLSARKLIDAKALLDIQGLKAAIARVFHGGLSPMEQMACIGWKELVRRETIGRKQKRFQRWEAFEKEMIAGHRYISAHSHWAAAHAQQINPSGTIFRNERMLRNAFYEAEPWQPAGNQIIFCSAAYAAPFKGLHVAVRALALLKDRFPRITLCIAGTHKKAGMRQSGYVSWVIQEAGRLGVSDRISWPGPLPAEGIVAQLQASAVFLVPSFAESYCVALAEAMLIGVPSVISYAGGLPHLAEPNASGLFFPPGDETMCAYQIGRILEDRVLAGRLSNSARSTGLHRNDRLRISCEQLKIYRQIIEDDSMPEGG